MQKRLFVGWPWMWVAVAWTVFVWVGRIRNLIGDDEMSSATRVGVSLLSASFLILCVLVVAGWILGSASVRALVLVTLGWTVAVWTIRVVDIAFLGDHEVPFIVIHTALGLLSVGLWSVSWKTLPTEP